MNIIKLQDMLRGAPDDALIGYVQNPQGEVPSYLALSELQRRKDTRAKYQAKQAPESSVAEDLGQQAAPQAQPQEAQGVAGLPIPDQMFSGQGMAAGGIVAFEDGGDVAASDAASSDMAPGSDLPSDYYMSDIQRSLMGRPPVYYTGATAGSSPSPAPSSPYGTDMIGEMMRVSPDAFRYSYGVGRGTSPYAGAAFSAIRKEMGSPGYADGGIVAFADGGMLKKARDYLLPPSPTTMRGLQGKTRLSPFMGGMGDMDAYQYADPNYLLKKREMLYKQLEMPGADKNAIYAEINALDQQTARPAGGYTPQEKPALTDVELQAKNTLSLTQQPPPPVVNPYATDTSIPRPLSVEEAMKREQEAMKLAGVDPEFYKKQSDELLAQREALKADRSEAGNLALIKAGLATMGGTSPFALVNLGKGAEAGIEQYGKDIKDIRAENRLLKQADMKLKEAQNAQQRGDAQGAIKAIQDREKLIAEYNHYKMTTGATLEAAKISAGTRTGMGQLPALYNALNKAQQAGNQALVDQIQARIDDIEAGVTGGGGAIPAGVTVKKNK
jgi:hypothetical protein